MNDPKIDELCQRIYKNHRRALDLIHEKVGSQKSGILADAETVLQEDPRWHIFWRATNVIDFVPKEWLTWLPPVGLDDPSYDARSWLIFRIELGTGKLDFYIEVRRMADLATRREIINRLIEEGPKFGFIRRSREVKDNYTRVSGRERLLGWDEDEPESVSIRTAVKKKLDELFPKLEGVPSVVKPILKNLVSAEDARNLGGLRSRQ